MKIMESAINMASTRHHREEEWKTVERTIKWNMELKGKIQSREDSIKPSEFKTLVQQLKIDMATVEAPQQSPADKIAVMRKEMEFLHRVFKELFSDEPGTKTFQFTSLQFSGKKSGFSFSRKMETTMEMSYSMKETVNRTYHEQETTKFRSEGVIKTASGESISFNLGLNMDREFMSKTTEYSQKEGVVKLIDPLVINFEGKPPQLSDIKFAFDLNMDGKEDNISKLMPGSGFLVFDRNGDGIVNDGGEMFGAETGEGFDELAELDMDGNRWIDENDPLFSRLSVWNMGESDSLIPLGEAGVGAINLMAQDTQFDLTGEGNSLNGRIEKTGIFLEESGEVGTIQQIKFTV